MRIPVVEAISVPFGKKLSLDSYVIAIFLSALDFGMIAPSLTVIATDLAFPVRWVIWVIALHLAVFVLALPLMEMWGARMGQSRWFVISLSLFSLGSLVAGAGSQWPALLCGRVIQALGAGGIVPLLSAELRRLTRLKSRLWRVAIHLGLGGLLILVPLFSSWVAWQYSWRWLFWVNLPAALAIYILSFRFSSGGGSRVPPQQTAGLFYFAGILLSSMVSVSRLNPSHGWGMLADPDFLPFAILSVGLIVPLLMAERQSEHPFFQPRMFTDLRLIGIHGVVALAGCTWVAVVLVPGWMVEMFGQPRGTGGVFLSVVAGAAWLTLPLARWITARWGYQGALAIGFFAIACAYFTLALVEDRFTFIVVLALLGGGLSLTLMAPVHELLFEILPLRQIKSGLMVIAMFRTAGGALGLLLIGLSLFEPVDPAHGVLWKAGFQMGLLTAAGAAVLGFVISLLLPLSDGSGSKED
ncbi:MFS transporter [Kroppenstedtia eburnea]|uniref:MFS transporter n=1 Tax=Kroppenstedtia eburnea TaxID=714067 RepID=UPI00020C8748|nr:MFS transporter [Kroppenstedtia eburnea]EGK13050.1 MFS family major facilitator transporter [Desmospora sp. 8437]QKI82515.1 MFS transporter [Kroppenstedtia eburnea]